jgi:hypothetical protein
LLTLRITKSRGAFFSIPNLTGGIFGVWIPSSPG